jgi:hypothetical protein
MMKNTVLLPQKYHRPAVKKQKNTTNEKN